MALTAAIAVVKANLRMEDVTTRWRCFSGKIISVCQLFMHLQVITCRFHSCNDSVPQIWGHCDLETFNNKHIFKNIAENYEKRKKINLPQWQYQRQALKAHHLITTLITGGASRRYNR